MGTVTRWHLTCDELDCLTQWTMHRFACQEEAQYEARAAGWHTTHAEPASDLCPEHARAKRLIA